MNMQTSFTLEPVDGGTKMLWNAEVSLLGPVGAMGQRVLQPIVKQQVNQVLGALDKRVTATVAETAAS
jgi:carbon monoxide dehydrogenase subunit G